MKYEIEFTGPVEENIANFMSGVVGKMVAEGHTVPDSELSAAEQFNLFTMVYMFPKDPLFRKALICFVELFSRIQFFGEDAVDYVMNSLLRAAERVLAAALGNMGNAENNAENTDDGK